MKKLLVFACSFLLLGCLATKEDSSLPENTEASTINKHSNKEVETGPIQIVEFFDFGCGHCKTAAKTMDSLKEKFGNQINVVSRHYPLSPKTFFLRLST